MKVAISVPDKIFHEAEILASVLNKPRSQLNVRIAKAESGLPKPSVVNVSQLLTIDRGLIAKKIKTLRASSLRKVDEGIRLVLAV